MSLSKVNETPIYTTTLPSTGQKLKYRPFLVSEERALLTAAESDDQNTLYASLESVVRACVQSPIDTLTTFDVEYLFIVIRSKSVGETSDIMIHCDDCDNDNTVTVNLKAVEVVIPEGHSKKIELAPEKIVLFKYPTIDQMLEVQDAKNKQELYAKLLKSSLHSVYYKDEIYVIAEEPEEEVDAFLSTLLPNESAKLKEFIDTIPYVQIKHSWTCKNPDCKKKHVTELKGIFSFF